MSSYLVTGGAGFIGSKLVEELLARDDEVILLDALTYSGRRDNLAQHLGNSRLIFVKGSICNSKIVTSLINAHCPRAIINVAAETHVDRSIDRSSDFIKTNVTGSGTLLCACLNHWYSLAGPQKRSFRFLQVSTDEVYGSIDHGAADEDATFLPNSPYAASKAAADHLVRAYYKTYGLPTLTTRGSNTYGPRQFPEKFIPLVILKALSGQSLPVYGDGQQVREWIHVDDHVAGILAVLARGEIGESYNIGSGFELKNIELVKSLCDKLGIRCPGKDFSKMIKFVEDRPGHDRRNFMNSSKAKTSLDWRCKVDFSEGLVGVIDWYMNNAEWWAPITNGRYDLAGLGSQEK